MPSYSREKGFDRLKESQRWNSIDYMLGQLKFAYKQQKERFSKTGEGPNQKERDMGAKNLRGTVIASCTSRGSANGD